VAVEPDLSAPDAELGGADIEVEPAGAGVEEPVVPDWVEPAADPALVEPVGGVEPEPVVWAMAIEPSNNADTAPAATILVFIRNSPESL
jgi:hypothetical protein